MLMQPAELQVDMSSVIIRPLNLQPLLQPLLFQELRESICVIRSTSVHIFLRHAQETGSGYHGPAHYQ